MVKKDSLGRKIVKLKAESLTGVPKKGSADRKPVWKNRPDSPINDDTIEVVIDAIEKGLTRADAARIIGVSPENLRKAIRRQPRWEAMVERAEVQCKFHHVKKIHSGEREWKASAWLLSRKWWREFGMRTPDSYSRDQVMMILLSMGRIIMDKVKDPGQRAEVMAAVQELSITLEQMKGDKAKGDRANYDT